MLTRLIDQVLGDRPRDERPKRCFHPSSLHKPADELYRLYLEGDNGEVFEPRILRIFDNGHAVHRRLQEYLSRAGVLIEAETPVRNEEYEIVGHADGIVEVKGKRGVLEIKSMNASTFHSTYEPKPEHLVQVNVYMFCLSLRRGVLLYECKDDQNLKEFYVMQDRAILDPILDKIRSVQNRIRAEGIGGNLPGFSTKMPVPDMSDRFRAGGGCRGGLGLGERPKRGCRWNRLEG